MTVLNNPTLCKKCGKEVWEDTADGFCETCFPYFGIAKNIRPGYAHMDFRSFIENPNNSRATGISKKFVSGDSKGVYLYGSVGSGKTHLLVSAMRELLGNMQYCRYHNTSELINVERFEYESSGEAEARITKKSLHTSNLFLDDFLSEKITEKSRQFFYYLFNTIIEKGKPRVFITSNKSISEVSELLDDRIASRIVGLCSIDNVVRIDDKDHRIKTLI